VTASTNTRGPRVEQVLDLAACGLRVFPLRPDDKRPAITEWETRATTDPDRIRAAWDGPYSRSGIGVACGPSGLVVVDCDTAKADESPAGGPGAVDGSDVLAALYEEHGDVLPFGRTPHARTGSGGAHWYFRAPDRPVRNSASKVGPKVDVRAGGGYVVAPPSTAAGRAYVWETSPMDVAPAPLPGWLLDLAAPPVPPLERPVMPAVVRDSTGYAAAALRGELQHVLDARPGTRNDTLHRAAFSLGTLVGAGRIDAQQTAQALLAAGAAIGLPEHEVRSTVTSGLRAGASNPRSTR
jgi:hypothetical protein